MYRQGRGLPENRNQYSECHRQRNPRKYPEQPTYPIALRRDDRGWLAGLQRSPHWWRGNLVLRKNNPAPETFELSLLIDPTLRTSPSGMRFERRCGIHASTVVETDYLDKENDKISHLSGRRSAGEGEGLKRSKLGEHVLIPVVCIAAAGVRQEKD